MFVAFAVDVDTGCEQLVDHRDMPALRRPVHRRRIIQQVARIGIEAAAQDLFDAVQVTFGGGEMEQRHLPLAAGE